VELPSTTISVLVIVATAASILALVVGIVALIGQRRVRRAYAVFSMGSRDDVLTLLQQHLDDVGLLRNDVRALRRATDVIRDLHRGALSRVGTIRYDAFDDMGGRLSFSTALVDERGDGVVLTSINGRTDARSYAKPLAAWASTHNLSSEEIAAIERARHSGAGRERTDVPDDPITADTVRPGSGSSRLRSGPGRVLDLSDEAVAAAADPHAGDG
jgi:hypothetical protein